ncbi:MAG: UDP-N-acetylmuramate dehydrogenase [Kordiimonadaceae bacterium]|jgi:UDP-N-acetylmuramate dehydrogenase|nr:UDP-N-acetylmuramate dehydrogenase [Kordiimonadaceae bacterium]MBT6031385.1 UDP-N-acetylmuramate dehydrogenase [Kordiimonadaceae bacterium]
MSVNKHQNNIHDFIPAARGKIEFDAPLAKLTWFRTGGSADVLFTPEDTQDLCEFLSKLPHDMPVMPLGVGSNLLIRDGGVEGVVIRFGKKFSDITIDGNLITISAGTPDISVARAALGAGLKGLEFLRGVPGTLGGALKMNAGAYGAEIKDIFVSAKAVDRSGKAHKLSQDDMGFSYRHTSVPDNYIFTEATLRGEPGDVSIIATKMKEIGDTREESQPLRTRTGGSTFKNPEGLSAWKLIDGAGCRGLKIGGARVSEKHCNFLINEGKATSKDIEELGDEVRRRVMNNSGVKLHWEIKRIGREK